jgi:hypothetical protein
VISDPDVDLEQLLKLTGQLGRYGDAAVSRGLPRTHSFAQARSVAAVAAHRCDEVFSLANTVTLWRLLASVEKRYEARWDHWLDNAADWTTFFAEVAALTSTDLEAALRAFSLVTEQSIAAVRSMEPGPGSRSLALPSGFTGARTDLEMLALGFSRGSVGALTVPYAKLGDR